MRKANVLWVLALGLAIVSGQSARAEDACAELQSQSLALEIADREQWEGQHAPADPHAIERQRTAVLEALAARGCRSADAKRVSRPNRFLAGIFGNERSIRSGRSPLSGDRFTGGDLSVGSYRTLCVRTCDGYYFPISFAASGDELKRDQNACRALCPGQDAAIYVQGKEDGGPMVSLGGEPYTALSNAFRYRSEYDPGCGCGPIDADVAKAFRVFALPHANRREIPPVEAVATPTVPIPSARARVDDPDTVANRTGRFVVQATSRPLAGDSIYREAPDGRLVRLVGPAAAFVGE
jgi:hypothetical protein